MTDVALGIDIGTSGVRIAARSVGGEFCAFSEAAMEQPIQVNDHVLQNPHIWWRAVELAFANLNLAGLNVRALAVDGTSGTILAVDEQGKPLDHASMYNDHAEISDVSKVEVAAPKHTAARGLTSPLARALNMGQGAARILHQADWVMGKFSGHYDVTDENNALKSGYDPVARQWPDWISRSGFNIDLFPRVVPVGTKIKNLSASIAKQFGLPNDVAVVSGTTDGCAAFLASGANEHGDGVTSLGTTLTLKLLSATPVFSPEYGIYSHRIRDHWLAGGASNSGGKVLSQIFSKEEMLRMTELLNPTIPTGLDYYPLPSMGERFPINDGNLAPRIMPRPADDATYFQALLEGIASIEAFGYECLAQLGASPLKTIRSVGGGAANKKWTEIRLQKLSVPNLLSASEHAAMGAARLAWWGLNVEN